MVRFRVWRVVVDLIAIMYPIIIDEVPCLGQSRFADVEVSGVEGYVL